MKKYNKWLKVLVLLGFVVFLTACGSTQEAVNAESTGLWYRYIIYNLSQLILWLSNLFGGSYPLGIAVFTIIIRALLLPLFQMQIKTQRKTQELQPELDAIKAKYPNKDRASMEAMQEEQQALMQDRCVNQFAGCLPMLSQLPVMMALYQAILRTEELRQGNFLWMNLGQPAPYFVLPVIAALLTFATTYFSMKSNPVQNTITKSMTFVSPLMILLIVFTLPSAIALYCVISNACTLAQTFILNNPYKIIAEREAKTEAEKEKQRELKRQLRRATSKKK